jgi:CHAD domain-containing protein
MERLSPTEGLARQRVASLTRTLRGARKGDAGAVHQARVATRRLREALPLVAPKHGRRLGRAVRRLTRALGPVRQLDVELATLDELQQSGDVPPRAVACLAETIVAERAALQLELVRRIDRVDLDKLRRKTIAAARATAMRRPARGRDSERIAAARARAARRAARLRAAIEAAAGIYLPERLHQVRIAVKKLRYAAEVARELRGSRAVARVRTLKRAQDLLGRLHDLEVLIVRARAVQASAKVPTLEVSADLDRLVRRLENECRQIHGRYMAGRAALLALCDRVEREAVSARASAA